MSEDTRNEEPRIERNDKLLIAGASLPIVEAAIAAMHGGPVGAIVGLGVSGLVYLVADEMAQRGKAIAFPRPSRPSRKQSEDGSGKKQGFFYRAFTAKDDRDEGGEDREEQDAATAGDPEEEALFSSGQEEAHVPGLRRLTIDEIVRHIPHNSYTAVIGRSMTQPGNRAVRINFYKRHIKLIGASQKGKSSMAAALLEMILRSHDPEYVLVALLDLEDRTSQLFADDPHILRVRDADGRLITLHARSEAEVLASLELLVQVMEYRYTLPIAEQQALPVILIYLEEFLELKDRFKARARGAKKDDKEQAVYDYERLVHCIKVLARRGLKVLVQFVMCAQVDYRDEDLQEALINVTSGMCFCVRASAAQAAGFYQTELLNRNAKENMRGVAVAEMPDCKDLILAPEYDLDAKLLVLQGRSTPSGQPQNDPFLGSPGVLPKGRENVVNTPVKPGEQVVERSGERQNVLLTFTEADEAKVLMAYQALEALSNGKSVTRTAIMQYLGWNKKDHYSQIVKPVCDKHHIAEREA